MTAEDLEKNYLTGRIEYLKARQQNTLRVTAPHTMATVLEDIRAASLAITNSYGIFIEIMPDVPLRVAIVAAQVAQPKTIAFAIEHEVEYIKRVIAHLRVKDKLILHGDLRPDKAIEIVKNLPGPRRDVIIDKPLADHQMAVLCIAYCLQEDNGLVTINMTPHMVKVLIPFINTNGTGDTKDAKQYFHTSIAELAKEQASPKKSLPEKKLLNPKDHSPKEKKQPVENNKLSTSALPGEKPIAESAESKKMRKALELITKKDERILEQLNQLKILAQYMKKIGVPDYSKSMFKDLLKLSQLYSRLDDVKEKAKVKAEILMLHTLAEQEYSWPKDHSVKQELLTLSRKTLSHHLEYCQRVPISFFKTREKSYINKQELQDINLANQAKELLKKEEDEGYTDSTLEYELSPPESTGIPL